MKQIITSPAYSLKDFRLLPGYTDERSSVNNVSLKTRLCCQKEDYIYMELPFMSAAMQAVTGVEMATALAELGGVGVLPLEASMEDQCKKVKTVKHYKAGFQTDIITLSPDALLGEIKKIIQETGYSIFPVTDTGVFHGRLLGVITDKDFDPRYDLDFPVSERMRKDVQAGVEVEDLKEANRLMIQYGHGFLPIVTREGTLQSVVFKKDLDKHIQHPHATVDHRKRLRVGAAVSTHPEDLERIKELAANDVDFIVMDSSDGFTCYQKQTLAWVKKKTNLAVIAGNVVTREGFEMLVKAGADAVKIGMGIGSGCITQEAKATGRGQATAILDIVNARDEYAKKHPYIPIIADGSISTPAEIAVALALGADSVMMGNFFARCLESPGKVENRNGRRVKEYWMEGSKKAQNYRRYHQNPDTFF
ncbi:MAG: IMP dehydrogenase, partial [Proteobacteria bacterium]|nr:IMP dehydrogenase [Pseudomonadota bacterium]